MRWVLVLLLVVAGQKKSPAVDSLKDSSCAGSKALLYSSVIAGASAGVVYFSGTDERAARFFNTGFRTSADDYMIFAPAMGLFFANSCSGGLTKAKHFLISNTITVITVQILKHTIKRIRPDGTDYSFPSGHTATAFTNAALLVMEYPDKPLVYVPGLLVATGAGVLRMVNNRHWLSDVLGGAAIGLLSAVSVYKIKLPYKWTGRNSKHIKTAFVPYFSGEHAGLALKIGF